MAREMFALSRRKVYGNCMWRPFSLLSMKKRMQCRKANTTCPEDDADVRMWNRDFIRSLYKPLNCCFLDAWRPVFPDMVLAAMLIWRMYWPYSIVFRWLPLWKNARIHLLVSHLTNQRRQLKPEGMFMQGMASMEEKLWSDDSVLFCPTSCFSKGLLSLLFCVCFTHIWTVSLGIRGFSSCAASNSNTEGVTNSVSQRLRYLLRYVDLTWLLSHQKVLVSKKRWVFIFGTEKFRFKSGCSGHLFSASTQRIQRRVLYFCYVDSNSFFWNHVFNTFTWRVQ